jgi:peptidylprolyl isomerase
MINMGLKKGDFITFDFTAKIKESNEVFDTTIEEVANKEKLKNQGDKYEPRLIVLGENWVLKAVDEALSTMKVGKSATVEIPPEKAFGARNNDQLKTVSLKSLLDRGIKPVVNSQLQSGGKTIIVRSVGAGRVVLDYNHTLAGKTLVYELTLKAILKTTEEKVKALLHRRIPNVEINKFKMEWTPITLTIEMPNETLNTEGIQQIKRSLSQEIQKFFPDLENINYLESFKASPKVAPPQKPTVSDTKKV